jgi:hypothetical protein
MNPLILAVLNIILLAQALHHARARVQFPNEDPRYAWGKLPWQAQIIPFLVLGIVHAGLYLLAKTTNLLNGYQVIAGIIFVGLVIYQFFQERRFNKQYGNPLQDVKVANVPIMSYAIGLMLVATVASVLIGALRLPVFYTYITFAVFMVLFIGLMLWGRKSIVKSQK